MVSIDDMKDLVLYKRPFFLPINPRDKKKNSEIFLLSPNYQSSINMMKTPYIINRRYFESYYLEKNVTRYINSDNMLEESAYDSIGEYLIEADLSYKDRKALPDSEFGIPSLRKYPLHDEEHVLLAIKFFNHVENKYEKELASNILKKIKKFDMYDRVNVSKKNRFYNYFIKAYPGYVNESDIESDSIHEEANPYDYVNNRIYASNIVYNGYEYDVMEVAKYINILLLKAIYKDCKIKYQKSKITINIVDRLEALGEITATELYVLSRRAFESNYGYTRSYEDYMKYLLYIFAYHKLNPNVIDTIVDPLCLYKSKILLNQLNKKYGKKYKFIKEFIDENNPDYKVKKMLGMVMIFEYIDTQYGYNIIHQIVKKNDINKVYELGFECIDKHLDITMKTDTVKKIKQDLSAFKLLDDAKVKSLFNKLLKESGIIHEEESDSEDTPTKIEDIEDLGKSITRKIRAATVYKLNKIGRDIEKGNVGSEKRSDSSITKLKAGNAVSIAMPNIATPSIGSSSSGGSKHESYIDPYILEQNAVLDNISGAIYFLESINYDANIKKALYMDRLRNNKQVLSIYNKVKSDCDFIRFAFLDPARYKNKNVFVDLSYYNETYFRNVSINDEYKKNTVRTLSVYRELLSRLITDDRFKSYNKKTIFIPVLDWRHNNSTRMWMYREDINPISVIYDLLRSEPKSLKSLFGDMDVIFLGGKNYFKINFSRIDLSKPTILMNKYTTMIKRIVSLGYNSPADPDPDDEPQNTASGIAMDIIDKVEKSQGITIKNVEPALKAKSKIIKIEPGSTEIRNDKREFEKAVKKTESENDKPIENKAADTSPEVVNKEDSEKNKDELVETIVKAAEESSTSEEAIDKLDEDEWFKELLIALNQDSEEGAKTNKARNARITQLSNEFEKKKVNGKSVKDLLKEDPNDIKLPETNLEVASINEEWKSMTFMNFDKLYDPDADMVKMLNSMKDWTFPISVRDIEIKDNSTSEDLVNLWSIACEDFKGTRFTLKVDIPKFINDKFLLLRGNRKSLMIQATLIPLIKTDSDTCQIVGIGGYNKIIIKTFNTSAGKANAIINKIHKAINKYGKFKISYGDNTKICNRYELPVDYIDMASVYNTIETEKYVLYFNQDELRSKYKVDDSKGLPIGIAKKSESVKEEMLIYYTPPSTQTYAHYIANDILGADKEFYDIISEIPNNGMRYMYSRASILNEKIPLILICGYLDGLTSVMNKAKIGYSFKQKLTIDDKRNLYLDYIRFSDGYLLYDITYSSTILMNGLKEFDTLAYSLKDINSKKMYLDFINRYGALKVDGIENSFDCMIDPITKEILEMYKLPSDYVSLMLYANSLLTDNKFIKHTDVSVKRLRRKELIAGYFYKALSSAYQTYANQIRRSRRSVKMTIKQSAVIDMLLSKDPSTNELSINNVVNDIESANTITSKGLVGLNTDRAYGLDKRGFDDTMLNVMSMSTSFSGTVGVNRQATLDCNIQGSRGLIVPIDNDINKLSSVKSLCASEALTPFGATHDDPFRTLMTHTQTSKHMVRCDNNDPMLVTNGADEAMAYISSDIFAYKAKQDGVVIEIVTSEEYNSQDNYMIIEYKDGTRDFVNLNQTVEKNSDGGYYVPLKLNTDLKVGQKVKAGSVLAYDRLSFSNNMGESGNLALNIGTLAKVAILNTDEGFEDSAACTARFANKISTEVIVEKEVVIDKNSNIIVHKKVGDHVDEGEVLLSYQAAFDDDVSNQLLKNLSMSDDDISELGRNPIRSKYTGTLEKIEVYRTIDIDDMSPSLQKFVKKYESSIKKMEKIYKENNIDTSTLPPTKKLDNVGKTKNVYDGVKIIFYIKYKDIVSLGDKIVLYSANKGIIKYIIDDNNAPRSEFRQNEPIDLFISVGSINGRMVCSTLKYGALAKLMIELDRSVKDIAGIKYNDSI